MVPKNSSHLKHVLFLENGQQYDFFHLCIQQKHIASNNEDEMIQIDILNKQEKLPWDEMKKVKKKDKDERKKKKKRKRKKRKRKKKKEKRKEDKKEEEKSLLSIYPFLQAFV